MASRRSALLNSPDARAKLIAVPSMAKAACIPLCIAALLAAGAAVCYFEWAAWKEDFGIKAKIFVPALFPLFLGGVLLILKTTIAVLTARVDILARCALRARVEAGHTCICDPDEQQWRNWVDAGWGPHGHAKKAQPSALRTMLYGLASAVIFTLLIGMGSIGDDDLPWTVCAIFGLVFGIALAVVQLTVTRLSRICRYRELRAKRHPLVFGPKSFYFAGQIVHSNVVSSLFVRTTTGSGVVCIITYIIKGDNDKVAKLSAPVGEGYLAEAKEYVGQHSSGFYRATLRPQQANNSIVAVPADGVVIVAP